MSATTVSKLHAWKVAIRPPTLLLALVPVGLGTAVAAVHGGTRWDAALAALIGAMLLQIAANVANDVFDFRKGADTEHRLGPPRAAAGGLLSPAELFAGLAVVLASALAVGVYLGFIAGWPMLVLGLAAMASAVAYTAGPFPLGYHGLGDVFVFVFFGIAAVVGTTYVQTQTIEPLSILLSLPVGALAMAVLNVNNVRDLATDREAGKLTLAVRLGPRAARVYYIALIVVAYTAVGVAIALGWLSLWGLAVVGSLPMAVRWVRRVWTGEGAELNPALGGTVKLQLLFGVLLLPGFLGLGGG